MKKSERTSEQKAGEYQSVYGFWDWVLLLLLIYALVEAILSKNQ